MAINSTSNRRDINPPQYTVHQKDDFGEPETSSWESSDAFEDEHVELQNLQPPQKQRGIDVEANETTPTTSRLQMLHDRIRNRLSPTAYNTLKAVVFVILGLAGFIVAFVIFMLFIAFLGKIVESLPWVNG